MELSELIKYKSTNHFLFTIRDSLEDVCNTPTNGGGVYIVYDLSDNKNELIYIGSSGQRNNDGSLKVRKSGLGGLKDRIVNGHQFGKIARKKSWIKQMQLEKIGTLIVHWWVTYDDNNQDFPTDMESNLRKKYKNNYNQLPRWNRI